MENKSCSSAKKSGHMKWMVLLAVIGLAVSFALPSVTWLPILVFLLCPLMMFMMMGSMHEHSNQERHSDCCSSSKKTESSLITNQQE